MHLFIHVWKLLHWREHCCSFRLAGRDFQELLTEYCWGAVWGDETLDRKTRSMLNLKMIAALNRMHEWELHFRGALVNGVTRDELKAVLSQIAIYCGVPVAVECHRIAKKVFAELDAEEQPNRA